MWLLYEYYSSCSVTHLPYQRDGLPDSSRILEE